jgi:Domain of unknown function (DUF5655)/Domain of unknown function (DUF4287)
MPKTAKKKSIYGVHPGVKMMADWIAGLKEKTGRTLDEWIALVKKSGPKDVAKCRDWLKNEHGFGTNVAWWITGQAIGNEPLDGDPDEYMKQAAVYVREQYEGAKAGLRPLYDALLEVASEIADDVKACPCKTIVPLYRNHVIAQIKPTTRTRIDFGLALAKYPGKIPARIIDTGGKEKKDRITHRIPVSTLSDIDAELKKWLKTAYELDG